MGDWLERQKEYKRVYARNKARERKEAHICSRCGGYVEGEGHRYCEKCRVEIRDIRREKVKIDKELGLCTKCEKQLARKGRDTCLACAVHESELRHIQYERKKNGLPRRRFVPEDADKIRAICECYEAGGTLKQVGDKFGFSTTTAYMLLTRNGVKMRKAWEYRTNKKVEGRA